MPCGGSIGDRDLRWLFLTSVLGGGGRGLGVVNVFVLFYLTLVIGLDTATAGLMYGALIVFSVPMPLIAGWLSDRLGRKPLIIGAYLGGAVGFAVFILAGSSMVWLWVGIVLMGLLLVRRVAAAPGPARGHRAAGDARRLLRAVLHAGVRRGLTVGRAVRRDHRHDGGGDRHPGGLRVDGDLVHRRGPGHAADPCGTAIDRRGRCARLGADAAAAILPGVDARILLVEDDPSIREVTAIGLRGAGFTVVTCDDGQAALERFAAEPFDLILLDVMLPRVDGLDVARAVRRTSTVPIVMLTARADTTDVVVGLEAGADDYVRKPFEVPELVARVRAALRRVGAKPSEGEGADASGQLRLGPLVIDVAGRTVTRDEHEIPLTRTEFDLLADLARHPGQVLDRDTLLDRIWGYDYLGDSRLVDVAVGRLRAKVEADPANPALILTVRGVGYKAAR